MKRFTGVSWSPCNRLVQKEKKGGGRGMLFFLPKRLTIIDLFEGLWWVGIRAFSPLAAVLGPEQKNVLCHPLPLFMVSIILL